MMRRRTWFVGMSVIGLVVGFAAAAIISGCGTSKSTTSMTSSVQVSSPSDGSVVRTSRITVRGTVSPPTATVQVLGRQAQVGNGIFTVSVPIHTGNNDIDVVAGGAGITPSTITFLITRKTAKKKSVTRYIDRSGGTVVNRGKTGCGNGIYVGPNTTCVFASNVADVYYSNPSSTIEVYSPVTNNTYMMSCTSGSPHVCTGGNNASVYFP